MKKLIHIFFACLLTSIGVILLKHSFIVTGGTAGLSLSLSYVFPLPFAAVFFIVNIPFYAFSFLRMGLKFTLSTIFAVTLLSLMTSLDALLPTFIIPMWFGAIAGGLIIGFGLSLLFMNGASLGGVNILALFLQKQYQIDPGKTNFIFDAIVVVTGIYSVGLVKGIFSILSIAVIGKVISYYKEEIATRNKKADPVVSHNKSYIASPQIPVAR